MSTTTAATAKKSRSKVPVTSKPTNVAEYVTWQIALCGKQQEQIADEVGFHKSNMISMIKTNRTKVPLEKIGPLAKSLGVDSIHLFKLCMSEYLPGAWMAIEDVIRQPVLTQNELEIIGILRECGVMNPKVRTDEERTRLIEAFASLEPDSAI